MVAGVRPVNDRCNRLRDKKRAEFGREQTRVKDILVEIKKKWAWAEHLMLRHDNLW